MLPRTFLPLLCAVLSLSMLACGSGSSTPISVPAPPTTLDGNWGLAGTRTPATYPILSTSLHVQGSQLTGRGTMQIQCSSTAPLSLQVDNSFELSGQVAADGTFTATSSTPRLPALAYTITLSGSSPTAAAPNTWTGTYTVTASLPSVNPPLAVTPCAYSHTFTATPIAALTGTYSGTVTSLLVSSGPVLGPNVALSLQVAQQPAAFVNHGALSTYELPLTGTLNVTGSTCFSSGSTASAQFPGRITGDIFQLTFLMNDGSQLVLAGNLSDLSASSLSVFAIVMGGSCPNVSTVATLIRH